MNERIAQEGDCLFENNLSLKAFFDRRRRLSYTVTLLRSCSEFSLRKFPHRAQPGVEASRASQAPWDKVSVH